MNCSEYAAPAHTMDQAVADLLQTVRWRFYPAPEALRRFHRDRRMLLYALTWPAVWLERRGLTCPPGRYRRLLADRLAAIGAHGDPRCYSPYFPRYLLKCLQDFFDRHGDDLYGELKHIRNALDQVVASLSRHSQMAAADARFAERVRNDARQLDVLVATHRLLHAPHRARRSRRDPGQLALF